VTALNPPVDLYFDKLTPPPTTTITLTPQRKLSVSSDDESLSVKTELASSFSTSSLSTLEGVPGGSSPEAASSEYRLDAALSREVGKEVFDAREFESISKFVASRIQNGLESSSFLVTNLTAVVDQFKQWKQELPMVEPFYAVKCNPDPVIVRLLASLGCNFDCATMGEIDMVLNGLGDDLSFGRRGLARSSIVYANPAKMPHMLQFALNNNVQMTVFDGEDELRKIHQVLVSSQVPLDSFKLLLRLTTDDKASVCRFSKKFGCPVDEAPKLLEIAQSLGLCVAGISFHVGSGCGDAAAYTTALEHGYRVFAAAESLGMPPMSIVDIGGGFPGDKGECILGDLPSFQDLARGIRTGISHFEECIAPRPLSSIRFLAEPGRYFVSASTMIATKIYSRKGGHNAFQALYVDDGVYGSFNNVVYDHALPIPAKLNLSSGEGLGLLDAESVAEPLIPSAVFGPTCDGLDQMCSLESTVLPRCEVGDWLVWDNMGAYTHTASFVFNGYTHIPQKSHCVL